DGYTVYRVGAGHHEAKDGVSALVIGNAFLVRAAQEERPLGAEDDFLQRVQEVLVTHVVLPAPGRQQRRFIDQVLYIRPREPRRRGGNLRQACVLREWNSAGVDVEDRVAAGLMREVNHDAPIEAARPKERFVEHVGLVGRCQDNDTLAAGEAVHFGEDLVQGLLLLARASDRDLPARAT